MSIFFNIEKQRLLTDAYSRAASATAFARAALTPLLAEADELLVADASASALAELDAIFHEFLAERTDLVERISLITTADARTAFLLSTTTGRRIDRMVAAEALATGWTYDEALMAQELDALLAGPRPMTADDHARTIELTEALARLAAPFSVANTRGDLDSDIYDPRVGVPLHIEAGTPLQRGRNLLIRALNDTATPDQILRDEFEVFFHDNGNLTLVLPGVIDLSSPNIGYDSETNSLRDLDQEAIESAFSTGVEDNGYAQRIVTWTEQMVADGVIRPGTPTTIIGHSFGGDTAFDLASDSHFNGDLLNVTHAFSAGYDSYPQLEHIPEHTSALNAVNIFDLAQLTERLSRNGYRPADRTIAATVERAVNATTPYLNRFRPVKIPRLELVDEVVIQFEPNGLLAEFEGGFTPSGVGHHQDNYIDFVERVDHPLIEQFISELDNEGFTASAVAVSVDISRPETSPEGDGS